MARPPFKPDPDQRRILAAMKRLADRIGDEERQLTAMVTAAVDSGVPIAVLADTLHVERKTIYRRIGRPM